MGAEKIHNAAGLLTLAATLTLACAAMASGNGPELWMLGNRPRLPAPGTRSAVKGQTQKRLMSANPLPAGELDEIARKTLGDILPAETVWRNILESDEESVSVCSFGAGNGLEMEFAVCGQLGNFAPCWCRVTGTGAGVFAENNFLSSPESLVSRAGGAFSADAVEFSSFSKDPIVAPYGKFEFAFSDDLPGANWCHPCRYVFFDAEGEGCTVLYKNAPPELTDAATGAAIPLVAGSPGRTPVADLATVTETVYGYAKNLASNATLDYTAGDATKTYCVLISGGGSAKSNSIRFWADTAMFYSTMTLKYGIPKEHIYAFVSDGLSDDKDASLSSGDSTVLVNSPHDLDGDGLVDVTGPAAWSPIQAAFKSLGERLTEDDQLVVFLTSHGGPDGVAGPDNYDSSASLFNTGGLSHSYIDDDELADLTRGIKCPVVFAIETCYSGGFVDDIVASPDRAIGTACNHHESSWGWGGSASVWDGKGYTGAANIWMAAFNSAVRGCKPKPCANSGYPWEDDTKSAVDADADGNRLVSFDEAGIWARDNDLNRCTNTVHGSWCDSTLEHPQYAQTDGAGMDFFFRKVDSGKIKVRYYPGAYGEGDSQTAFKEPGSPLALEGALFTRKGYRQTGWALSDGGQKAYDLGGEYADDAGVTLYPCWTANTYTVAFDLGNGETRESMEVAFGEAFRIKAPSQEGCKCMGWKVTGGMDPSTARWGTGNHPSSEVSSSETLCGGDYDADVWFKSLASADGGEVTLVAQWTERLYTMTFDAAGGDGGTVKPRHFGDPLLPPTVSREGYSLSGWVPEVPSTVPAKNMVFTAQWTAKQYWVTFDANGGEGGWSRQMEYGSRLVAPVVVREGYMFTRWRPVSVPSTVPAKNATYTAQWKILQYTVTFDANGGEGGWSRKMDYGAKITPPEVTREGFEFSGWSPADVADTVPGHDVTYVARWNTFLVTFDANGGESVEDRRDVVKGAAVGPLPGAARAGYAFQGWFTEAVGGVQAKETLKVSGDTVLYAHWRFVGRADEENIYFNTASSYETEKDGSFLLDLGELVESYSEPKLAVKGLPAGLKFDSKTLVISGIATKPGVYKVVVSATNQTVKKAQTAEFALRVPNITTPAFERAGLADEYSAPAGIPQDMETILAKLEEDGWKVSVSGLPAGLKFDANANAITGVATKEGPFTVTITAVRGNEKEISTATVNVSFPVLSLAVAPWDDATAAGTVSGGGAYPAGKKVTLKAVPAKGCVFAGWFGSGGEPLQGALDYRTASYSYTTGAEDVEIVAKFATAAEDETGLSLDLADGETAPDGSYSLDLGALVKSPSLPKLAVKGLPAGLKFDAKTLVVGGKATKPGSYPVSVTARNSSVKKGLVAGFTLVVPNLSSSALPGLLSATWAYGTVHAGVAFPPDLVECSPAEGWSVKVSGLPAGLKFDAATNTIKGVPTKAGTATVVFTAFKKGFPNETATITLTVAGLPEWVSGTFNGAVWNGEDVAGLVQSLSVAANGKISAKLLDGGPQLSLAAPSFDSFDNAAGAYIATLTGKLGNLAVTNEMAISSEKLGDSVRGVAESVDGSWTAWQNLWKDKERAAVAASLKNHPPVVLAGTADGLPGDEDTITVKFGASGAATAAAVFMTANEKTGAKVKYSAASSGVLVPESDGSYSLYVYFPPKSGTTFSTPFAKRIRLEL